MDAICREKFISLLKDSVLALCKNGFIDDHGITRVDGLLGITLKSKEVLLVNIGEELLPPTAHSSRSREPEPSVPGRIPAEESPLKLAAAAENRPAKFRRGGLTRTAVDFGRSEVEEVRSDVEDGSCREDKENLRGNVCQPGVVGPRLMKDENESRDEDTAMICDSGRGDDADIVDISGPLELLHRATEEFACNSTGQTFGNLQNFDSNLTCQATTDGDLALLWPNETKDARLPGTVDPAGYLPLLGYHRPVNSSAPASSSLPFPSLLPMFYNCSESVRALTVPHRRCHRPSGRQTKKYCCDICDYKSNRSYNLLRHVMHVHAVGSCPCVDCGAVFDHKMQLRAHRIEAHGDAGTGSAGYSLHPVKMEPQETVQS